MASTFTLTGDLATLGLTTFATKKVRAHIRSNLGKGDALIDSTAGLVMLGDEKVDVASDGTFTVDLIDTDATDLNVEAGTLRYELVVDYVAGGSLSRVGYSSGWFELTASADISELDLDLPSVTPAWRTAFTAEMEALLAETEAARDGAVAIVGPVDGTVEALVLNTGGVGPLTSAALSATYAMRGAPGVPAPLLVATPLTVTKTGTSAVGGYNPATGTFYGSSTANGHYITSTDLVTWTDRAYSPSAYTPGAVPMQFDATYMYAHTTATNGKVWRAPLDVFNGWTEITVPGLGPLTTSRAGSLCALGGGVLVFGNYTSGAGDGSHIWRSTDAGATWTEVLTVAGGKHVHAIRRNPADGTVWASLGDATYDGIGLYKSTDAGATWTLMSSNEYGIDMVFVPAAEGRPALVVLEGDGLNRPHLIAFPQDGEPGDKTFPLVWFTGAPSTADTTRGTTRGIGLTATNDILYWVTTEGGAVGSKAGLYVAQAPDYTRSILLYDTTGAEPVGYTQTFTSGAVAQNYLWTFTTPTFGSY